MRKGEIGLFLIYFLFFTGNIFYLKTNFLSITVSPLNFEEDYEWKSSNFKRTDMGSISLNDQNLFWFIQITDIQQTWYDDEQVNNFYQFLNESYNEIDPLFIYNTGDLVDADNGVKQDKEEWKRYKKALDENYMNASIYYDLIGNHDAAADSSFSHFLNYSMMGRKFNTTQYSFNKTFSFGKYAFIGINTAKEDYDPIDFSFFGFLDTEELDWYEKQLEKYKEFDKLFVFGHHPYKFPPFLTIISNLTSSGKTFSDLNKEYNIFSYFSGHVHLNSHQNEDGFLMITTANFNQDNGTYRIISLDHNQISTSIENVGTWPQGIITYPPREDYITESTKYSVNKIRVLAWDPQGVQSVKWGIFDTKDERQIKDWEILTKIDDKEPLWEDNWDFITRGKFLIKVQIEGGSGEVVKEIIFNLKSDLYIEPIFSIILLFLALISIPIIITYYLKTHISKNRK